MSRGLLPASTFPDHRLRSTGFSLPAGTLGLDGKLRQWWEWRSPATACAPGDKRRFSDESPSKDRTDRQGPGPLDISPGDSVGPLLGMMSEVCVPAPIFSRLQSAPNRISLPAGAGKGGVSGTQRPGYVSALERNVDDGGIRWAGLKRPERALEKTLRCYQGDARRLCDLVRQTIVFDAVDDLTNCLELVARDCDYFVVRAKNRYAPDYDAEESAGYRDVLLNLRMETEAGGALGHVCELQLVLLPFHQRRSDRGHRAYVAFRNLLGR